MRAKLNSWKKKFLISILKSLKQTAMKWILQLDWVISAEEAIETYRYYANGV